MSGITRVGHVGLGVRDLDRAVEFYCGVLGFELSERFDYPQDEPGHGMTAAAAAFVRFGSRHHNLSIFAIRNAPDGPNSSCGLHHIAFEVESKERLVALYHELLAKDVDVVAARRGGPGNQPRFYARDPEGNLLEFYWSIDRIGWDGLTRPFDPIEDIDLEDFDFAAFEATRRDDARNRSHSPDRT